MKVELLGPSRKGSDYHVVGVVELVDGEAVLDAGAMRVLTGEDAVTVPTPDLSRAATPADGAMFLRQLHEHLRGVGLATAFTE